MLPHLYILIFQIFCKEGRYLFKQTDTPSLWLGRVTRTP